MSLAEELPRLCASDNRRSGVAITTLPLRQLPNASVGTFGSSSSRGRPSYEINMTPWRGR